MGLLFTQFNCFFEYVFLRLPDFRLLRQESLCFEGVFNHGPDLLNRRNTLHGFCLDHNVANSGCLCRTRNNRYS